MHAVTGRGTEACTTLPVSLGQKELILTNKTQHDREIEEYGKSFLLGLGTRDPYFHFATADGALLGGNK